MKFKLNQNFNIAELFSKDYKPPTYEEKATYYGSSQVEEWEMQLKAALSQLEMSDHKVGLKQLFALAEEGDPESRRILSEMYIDGKGVPKDFSKAVEWHRRAEYSERLFFKGNGIIN